MGAQPHLLRSMTLCGAIAWSTIVSAEPLSWLGQQYADSANRTSTAIAAFVTKLGLDESWISYCQTTLRIQIGSPLIGSVYPFNVDLPEDSSSKQATDVLKIKEDYERNYLTLCLANVKRTLPN